jgi:hypothetical protein
LSCTADGWDGGYDKLVYTHSTAEDKMFISFWINKQVDWSNDIAGSANAKFFRIYQGTVDDGNFVLSDNKDYYVLNHSYWGAEGTAAGSGGVMQYSSDEDAGGCTSVSHSTPGGIAIDRASGSCMTDSYVYEHWEIYMDYPPSRGSTSTEYAIYRDGACLSRTTGATFDQAGQNNTQRLVLIGAVTAGGFTTDPEYLVDSVYIDNTRAHVFISDSSTLTYPDTSIFHAKELQIPSAWSDTSITATVNQGVLTGTKYLYVVNASGEINSSGYEVTFGGGEGSSGSRMGAGCSASGGVSIR